MTFIHCRHNSVAYAVSKQHKHHSTYPSMCHCYEPGHFANIFPQVPFQHHLDTQDCISQTVWPDLKVASVQMHRYICIYRLSLIDISVVDGRKTGSHWTHYCHTKTTYTHIKGRRVMAHLVEALPLKSEGRKFNYRCCHWNIAFTWSSGRTVALRSTQPKQKWEIEILGASASWIPHVLSTPVMG